MLIRPVRLTDVEAITEIYAHHVRHGTASYETVPPSPEEMAARIARVTDAGWPWLVAAAPGAEPHGYAYATQFRDRAAYRFVCEDSIYIREDSRGHGVGTTLLTALIEACTAAGFRQMVAVIGGAEPGSVALHARLGFAHAGQLSAIGRKHGRWLDTLYMQLPLGAGANDAPPFEPD